MKKKISKYLQNASYALRLTHRLANQCTAPRIIMFHGVEPRSLTSKAFESILVYLKKYYKIVPLHDLIQGKSNKAPKIKVALTFDDGLRNNYTTAYRLLNKHGLPATFFVCPSLVTESTWLWNHQARARISRLSESQNSSFKNEINQYGYEGGDIVEWMKTIKIPVRNEVSGLLTKLTPTFRPTQEERESYDMMSSEELLDLDPKLISIGSHTKSHPILSHLDSAALFDEIANSKTDLEDIIKRPVSHFCYPNGDFTDEVLALVQDHYEAAVTDKKGVFHHVSNLFKVPRIGAAETVAYQAWRMWRPGA